MQKLYGSVSQLSQLSGRPFLLSVWCMYLYTWPTKVQPVRLTCLKLKHACVLSHVSCGHALYKHIQQTHRCVHTHALMHIQTQTFVQHACLDTHMQCWHKAQEKRHAHPCAWPLPVHTWHSHACTHARGSGCRCNLSVTVWQWQRSSCSINEVRWHGAGCAGSVSGSAQFTLDPRRG